MMADGGHSRCGRVLAGLALLVVCSVSGCVATVEPHTPVHLRMAGSSSMQSLMHKLAEAYTGRYDHVIIDIDARGSRLGLEALREGTVDLALVSREMGSDEEEGLTATLIARDAIAILVNDGNMVESLTSQQLKDIFSGHILLWSDVGGEEVDVQVLSREDGSGTREAFEGMVMGDSSVTQTAIVLPGDRAVCQFVAEHALTIGYASAADIPLGTRALRIDGVNPDLRAVSEGDYALVRPFILVSRQRPEDEVQAFVDFVASPAGQVIVGWRYGRAM